MGWDGAGDQDSVHTQESAYIAGARCLSQLPRVEVQPVIRELCSRVGGVGGPCGDGEVSLIKPELEQAKAVRLPEALLSPAKDERGLLCRATWLAW